MVTAQSLFTLTNNLPAGVAPRARPQKHSLFLRPQGGLLRLSCLNNITVGVAPRARPQKPSSFLRPQGGPPTTLVPQ
jgi:hypothetical protein